MPHSFEAHPKHPAVAFLVRLHADLGGRIKANRAEAKRLAEGMKHVEAVLKMFDPDFNARGIAARRRITGNPWFKRGTLFRAALEALRDVDGPITVRELADAMLARKGVQNASPKQHGLLQSALRASLENHASKTVERVGEGSPMRWKLT